MFHLWWHPHNFGVDLQENLDVLRALLAHFRMLQGEFDMVSCSMADVAAAAAQVPPA